MTRQPGDDFLRAELREALAARQPDRTAMLNRIAANRAEQSRPRWRGLRLAGSALAVATVLGLGGVAKWAMADDDAPVPLPAAPPVVTAPATSPAATSPAPSPAAPPPATPTTRPATSRPASSAPPSPTAPSASPVRGHPGDTQVEKGSLRSAVSLDGGASTVTLIAAADLTELDLTIRVVRTDGLTPAGGTHDAPAGDVTATVQRPAGAFLYHFTLRPGATLRAGTYRFTARYADGAGRNARDDTYEAYAFSVERKRLHLYGNFFPED